MGAEFYTCPQGHRWEIGPDTQTRANEEAVLCPVCGAAVSTFATLRPVQRGASGEETLAPSQVPSAVAPVETAPVVVALTPPPQAGRGSLPTIPGYELLSILGRGGMGVVYKARQLTLNCLVALKMIVAGAHASPQVLARFHLEAEAVASLQHPHIVQIHEVGEHDHCPYLSLEFMDGGSLDMKLAGAPQPPPQAAQLIETLARAMHLAHQRGIVHRDLKPANVLLTKDGVPKIADFGLAKRLEEKGSPTRTGIVIGTPGYMAPEQAGGLTHEIGPAVDVYALGAILYEMLTGRPPFVAATTLDAVLQTRTQEPVPPTRLQPKVPRDLETICLKCLAKQPAKRYATAEALAEDLRRFQHNEPIEARPVTLVERWWKWVQRRPAAAALLGVSIGAATALGVQGVWSHFRLEEAAARAEERSRMARRVVDEMYTKVAEDWLADDPQKDPVRQEFLEKALRLYEEFAQENRTDPAIRKETAMAHFRLGQIHRTLNQHDEAEQSYGRAIVLQEELRHQFPAEPGYRQDLANSYNWLGELLREGEQRPLHEAQPPLDEVEQSYRKAQELQEQLVAECPERLAYQKELARSRYNLGIVLRHTGRRGEAKVSYDRAIGLLTQLTERDREDPEYRHALAQCSIDRAVLQTDNAQLREAHEDLGRAIRLLENLRGEFRSKAVYKYDLAVSRRNLGNLLFRERKPPEALAELHSALKLLGELKDDFPARPNYQKKLGHTYISLGVVLAHTGELAGAQAELRKALLLLEPLVAAHPKVVEYQKLVGETLGYLGWAEFGEKNRAETERHAIEVLGELLVAPATSPGGMLWERCRLLEARSHFEKAIPHLEVAFRTNPLSSGYRAALRDQYQNLAETLVQLRDHAAATKAATALAEMFPEKAQGFYDAACFMARCVPLAQTEALRNQYVATAVALLRQALRQGSRNIERVSTETVLFKPLEQHPAFRDLLAALVRPQE